MDLGLRINGFVDLLKGIGLPWWAQPNGQHNGRPGVLGYFLRRLDRQQMEHMWRGDDIMSRAIERVAEDMVREGWELDTGEAALDEQLMDRMDALQVRERFREAIEFQRGVGGAAVLMGANDSRNLAEPLVPGMVHSVDWLRVIDSWELTAEVWDRDLKSPTFDEPLIYRWSNPDGGVPVDIHRSRLLIFNGKVTTRSHRRERSGWGDPVTLRMVDAVEGFKLAWSTAYALMKVPSQPVYRLKDLINFVETARGQELLTKRLQVINDFRSAMNAIVLDKEDEFEQVATNLASVPELLDRNAVRVSGSADIPAALLMGQSPAGMDATGDAEFRGHYDRIHARQEIELAPHIKHLAALVIPSIRPGWRGRVKVTFNPLWQMSELEQAQTGRVKAETAQVASGAKPASQPPRNGIAHSDAVT